MKVLCGFHVSDDGEMKLLGEDYRPQDAASAIARGVVTVHQSIDDGVIPDFDVATNLMLNTLLMLVVMILPQQDTYPL